ncbi:MAG: alpha/beta hydrolase [bacterium]|nr:alpha/beta hydrolase [bacterium]
MSSEGLMAWVEVVGKVVMYGGILVVAGSVVCSYLLTSYRTFSTFEVTPLDFGIGYERFSVAGVQGARLGCWYVPAEGMRGIVIVSHGIGDSKQGVLPYVVKFHRAGYGLVLYDLRRHGESSGKYCTIGYYETEDLVRVTAHVRREYADGKPILYWGFSLGGTISLLAAGRDEGVRAVVAQSPFPSLREVVKHYAWVFYWIPPVPVVALGLKLMEWRTGVRAEEVDVRVVAEKLRGRPVLLIGSERDRQVPLRWLEGMKREFGEGAELVVGPYGHDDGFLTSEEVEGGCADIDHAIAFFDRVIGGGKGR